MNSAIKTTNVHALNLAPLSQLPSFTSLSSTGGPHLSDKIIHYITRSAKSPNFTSVFKKLWQEKSSLKQGMCNLSKQ